MPYRGSRYTPVSRSPTAGSPRKCNDRQRHESFALHTARWQAWHPPMHASKGRLLGYAVNAPMESFFHTLKTELVMHCDCRSREQARSSLFDDMKVFHDRQRRHSTQTGPFSQM